MKKWQFTENVAKLILWCREQGYYVFMDYGLRSAEEQKRLFDKGLSRCNGASTISAHQYGKHPHGHFAVDLPMCGNDWDINSPEPYERAHDFWSTLGGAPMISWDKAHFEA